MKDNNEMIGQTVHEQLQFVDKTQDEFAEYLDVSITTVKNLLKGHTKWNLDYLIQAAQFVECCVEDLIEWSEIEYEAPETSDEPAFYNMDIL